MRVESLVVCLSIWYWERKYWLRVISCRKNFTKKRFFMRCCFYGFYFLNLKKQEIKTIDEIFYRTRSKITVSGYRWYSIKNRTNLWNSPVLFYLFKMVMSVLPSVGPPEIAVMSFLPSLSALDTFPKWRKYPNYSILMWNCGHWTT